MNCNAIRKIWGAASYLSIFFNGLGKWLDTYNPKCCDDREKTEEMYNALFKGTNADMYIPLWASAVVDGNDILYNKTTYDIICRYKQCGFVPYTPDGNPPDYIGEMLDFICYLSASEMYLINEGKDYNFYQMQIDNIFSEYVFETLRVIKDGIEKNDKDGMFRSITCLIETFLQDGNFNFSDGFQLLHEDTLKKGPNNPVLVEPQRWINTSGRNNCGGKCGISYLVSEGCILNQSVPKIFSDIGIKPCIKGLNYKSTYLSGRRLRYPMIRTGKRGEGKFKRVSWYEAEKIILNEWTRIKNQYGPGSRYVLYGTGVVGVLNPGDLAKRLLNLDGGYLEGYLSYSALCTDFITPYIYGDTYSANSAEDILNSKLLILWGHNPSETKFGSQRNQFLKKAKENGLYVVVIDPRQSDTAIAYADEWIGIRPSTDGALADAMAYVIVSEGLHDQHFLDKYTIGFDSNHMPKGVPKSLNYRDYLFGLVDGIKKTPEWGQNITGVPAAKIEELARLYAKTKPSCIMPGLSNQRTGNGEQTVRAMAALACITGNIGVPGGGAANAGYCREETLPFIDTGNNPYGGEISAFQWTEAIENSDCVIFGDRYGTKQTIKMILCLASNTLINQHSNIHNTESILKDTEKCECIICSDVFMTASARYADILLPAPSFLEESNISIPWRTGHYLASNNQVIAPLFESRNEFYWLKTVAKYINMEKEWCNNAKTPKEWIEAVYEDLREKENELPDYKQFEKDGGYVYKNTKSYVAYRDKIEDFENNKFNTPSGKIELVSQRLYEKKIPGIPAYVCYVPAENGYEEKDDAYPLQLISWHSKRRTHTIHDSNKGMNKSEPQKVWVNPEDALLYGIVSDDIVLISSRQGKMIIPAFVTDRIIKGVVAVAQGAWYQPNDIGTDVAGSVNVLTSYSPTPLAKGNPQQTNRVQIEKINNEK